MIHWSRYFPKRKYLSGYIKLLKAYYMYLEHPVFDTKDPMILGYISLKGKQGELAKLRNIHKGKRGFIIANGPSLSKMDLTPLKDEITIGCNGIYKKFDEWGFHTTYLMVEDVVQTEIRGKELSALKGPIKLAALHNAHSFDFFNDFLFFNIPKIRHYHDYYFEEPLYPQFSKDFASIVHLGCTVTYLMLQFAYHLGFSEVYIIGLDHNYGKLPELFPPGKIKITEENYHLVQECHFDKNYYKIGDVIGVPWVKKQEAAYKLAKEIFEKDNIVIKNIGFDSKLDIFEKDDYYKIIEKKNG